MRTCPRCDNAIPDHGIKICPYCAQIIEEVDFSSEVTPSAPPVPPAPPVETPPVQPASSAPSKDASTSSKPASNGMLNSAGQGSSSNSSGSSGGYSDSGGSGNKSENKYIIPVIAAIVVVGLIIVVKIISGLIIKVHDYANSGDTPSQVKEEAAPPAAEESSGRRVPTKQQAQTGNNDKQEQSASDEDDEDVSAYDEPEYSEEEETEECPRCGRSIYVNREWEPSDTYNEKEHDYALYIDDITWKQAEDKCESMGGHLVTFTADEEIDVVEKLLKQEGIYDEYYHLWIGARCTGREDDRCKIKGVVKGEKWVANWLKGEPSHWDDSVDKNNPIEEEYIDMVYLPKRNQSRKWLWLDVPNDISNIYPGKIGYICEWDHVIAD